MFPFQHDFWSDSAISYTSGSQEEFINLPPTAVVRRNWFYKCEKHTEKFDGYVKTYTGCGGTKSIRAVGLISFLCRKNSTSVYLCVQATQSAVSVHHWTVTFIFVE